MGLMGTLAKMAIGYAAARGVDRMSGGQGLGSMLGGGAQIKGKEPASRMQSQGLPGRIQLTEATRNALPASFHCERRGTLRVRGKGRMPTWFLISEGNGHAA